MKISQESKKLRPHSLTLFCTHQRSTKCRARETRDQISKCIILSGGGTAGAVPAHVVVAVLAVVAGLPVDYLFIPKNTHKNNKQKKYNNNAIYRQIQSLISKCKKIKTTIRSQNGSEYTHTPIFISVIPADICCNFFCSVKSKTTIRIQEYVHVRIRCDWVCVCVSFCRLMWAVERKMP